MAVGLFDDPYAQQAMGDLPDALDLLPHQPPIRLHPDEAPAQHIVADDDPGEELGVVASVDVDDVLDIVLGLPWLLGHAQCAVFLLRDEEEVALLDAYFLGPGHG